MSRSSSSSVAPSAAVRTMRPASAGRNRSSTRRRRLRSSSGSRLEMPYVCGWPGHHDDEAAREAHLLGEPRALVRDRVLRDLHDDRLAVAQHPLDARLLALLAALDVVGVVRDVAAVEHTVLGRADVDERGFHAGQHVLDAAEIDVAVDRRVLVGRRRDVVLDQLAAFEHADVGEAVVADVHDHEVPAGGAALAARAPPPLQASPRRASRATRCRRRRRRRARRRRRTGPCPGPDCCRRRIGPPGPGPEPVRRAAPAPPP